MLHGDGGKSKAKTMSSAVETEGRHAGGTCDDDRPRVNGPGLAKEEVEASYTEHWRFNGVFGTDASEVERFGCEKEKLVTKNG